MNGMPLPPVTNNLFVFNVTKLVWLFSIILLLSLLSLSYLIVFKQTPLLEQQATDLSEALVYQAAYSLKDPLLTDNDSKTKVILDNLQKKYTVIGVNLYNKDYSLVYSQGFKPKKIDFPIETENYKLQTEVLEKSFIHNNSVSIYTIKVHYNVLLLGYLSVSFEQKLLAKFKKEILSLFSWVLLSALSICIMAAFYINKWVNKPLNDLMTASSMLNSGFKNEKRHDELEEFIHSFNQMDKRFLQKDKVEAVFSRYVSPQVAKEVLNDLDSLTEVELGGEHLTASVFFADIVGFTSLSETMEPQDISNLLNVYFSKVTEVVSFCGGHVDKFIGDCAMVVFGVPIKKEQHAFDCIACAWMILELLNKLNQSRESEGKMRVEFRIGANSGTMLAGNMGSSKRMEYTVVGDSVNLASRLCGSAEPSELIITEDMFIEQNLDGLIEVEDKDFIKLRGKKLPIKTLIVSNILTPFKQKMLDEIPLIIEKSNG
jgi:adenylate cyclase